MIGMEFTVVRFLLPFFATHFERLSEAWCLALYLDSSLAVWGWSGGDFVSSGLFLNLYIPVLRLKRFILMFIAIWILILILRYSSVMCLELIFAGFQVLVHLLLTSWLLFFFLVWVRFCSTTVFCKSLEVLELSSSLLGAFVAGEYTHLPVLKNAQLRGQTEKGRRCLVLVGTMKY
jgi:hypothetical protein